MQNRYVGDVGDYGKYALLRELFSGSGMGLAVAWCLYPDEDHNSDGRHVSYLNKDEYRKLDPDLFDKLKHLVRGNERTVTALRREQVLPEKTIYFERPTRPSMSQTSPAQRVAYRQDWLRECLAVTMDSHIVFFDPDNGLASASVTIRHPKAGKYVFIDELRSFTERGQTVVLYHHLNRTASALVQVAALIRILQDLGSGLRAFPLLYRRGSCRVFCILAPKRDADRIEQSIEGMLERGWRRHFELVPVG
jgi:hypothetical protein